MHTHAWLQSNNIRNLLIILDLINLYIVFQFFTKQFFEF